jgi:hypothetical protein
MKTKNEYRERLALFAHESACNPHNLPWVVWVLCEIAYILLDIRELIEQKGMEKRWQRDSG